jgi:DNA-binding MarR family transcriptional regulator
VPEVVALTDSEGAFFSALMRIVSTLPRRLDSDLVSSVGLTSNEYCILRTLSEAPDHEGRMAELARAACVSQSRISRLVGELHARGLVEKGRSSADGRGQLTTLTPAGLAKLNSAWPVHMVSVRGRVFDHLEPEFVAAAAVPLLALATALEQAQRINEWGKD